MTNKQFQTFILAELDKIPIHYYRPPNYVIMMARRIGTFGQFRLSDLYNKIQIVPFPARVIKIKWQSGEWVLSPAVDLRALRDQVIKFKPLSKSDNKIENTPSLQQALASGQVTFEENNNE